MSRPIFVNSHSTQPTCLQTTIIPHNQNYPLLIQDARKG